MKWFKVFTVGVMAAILAACNSGGSGQGQVGRISISPSKVEVGADQSKSLTATVRDSAGNILSNKEVSWEVMDPQVAEVASKGKLSATLKGLKSGETEVYATVGGIQSTPVQVIVSGSNPQPTPGKVFSGTLTVPEGGDVKGSVIYACAYKNQSCDPGDPRTKFLDISASGRSFNFSLEVQDGDYFIGGFKDLNQNKKLDEGDYHVLCFVDNQPCKGLSPPRQGLELRTVLAGWNKKDFPSGDSSISGKVFAVRGSSLRSVEMFACEKIDGKKCAFAWYLGDATQSQLTLKVPSGRYTLLAFGDVNQNGKLDVGDHYGCFGRVGLSGCTVFDVKGAVTEKDIHLAVWTGSGEVQSLAAKLAPLIDTNNHPASLSAAQLERLLEK